MPTKPIDTRTLGDLTALQARNGEYPAAIARVTDLPEDEVRRRLARGAGKRRVWRLFDEEWPGREREEVLAERGSMTVATAREENHALQLATITGLTEETVRARMAASQPGQRVRGVFAVEWPPGIAARGRMSVEDASGFWPLAQAIASITGLSTEESYDRLSQAEPTMLVRDVFRSEWPEKYLSVPEGAHEETDEEAWYGRRRCSQVRGANRAARIAKDMGLSEAEVRARLDAASGRRLVRAVFAAEWPSKVEDGAGPQRKGATGYTASSAARQSPSERASFGQGAAHVSGGNVEPVSMGQGSDVHRLLQQRIARIGMVRGDHAETDKLLDAGFRPDVAWFKPDAVNHNPWHVFEIERGPHGAKAKSLQSLQLAHARFNSDITLLVHESHLNAVRKMVPSSIERRLHLLTIESCLACGDDLARLARMLHIEVGEYR